MRVVQKKTNKQYLRKKNPMMIVAMSTITTVLTIITKIIITMNITIGKNAITHVILLTIAEEDQ